jgi:hypothetical protein
MINADNILVERTQNNRQIESSGRRWNDKMKMNFRSIGVDCVNKCRVLVNTSQVYTSFSRNTVSHWIRQFQCVSSQQIQVAYYCLISKQSCSNDNNTMETWIIIIIIIIITVILLFWMS